MRTEDASSTGRRQTHGPLGDAVLSRSESPDRTPETEPNLHRPFDLCVT